MNNQKNIQADIFEEEDSFHWMGIVQDGGVRLDVFLAQELSEAHLTRSFIQNQIKQKNAFVNQIVQKANYQVKTGDQVTFTWPIPTIYEVQPENIPLEIVYQDVDIAVINKPKGMVVHPAPGHMNGTLVHALLFHLSDLAGIGGVMRPGIVHRIDKDTSGLLVIAKNDAAHQSLSQQMKTKEAGRIYVAMIRGYISESIRVDEPIGRSLRDRKKMAVIANGRDAATNIETIETYRGYSLVRCSLETGRTHQIRVHLAHIKHPIVGDTIYGSSGGDLGMQTQALHAYELHLKHPTTNELMKFQADPPKDFLDVVMKLRKDADLFPINEALGW